MSYLPSDEGMKLFQRHENIGCAARAYLSPSPQTDVL